MLAYGGYEGMKGVLERPYGGFLTMFAQQKDSTNSFDVHEVTKDFGTKWHTTEIRTKIHACVGGAYGIIQCIENLQRQHTETLDRLDAIERIQLEISGKLMGHCGWKPTRPIQATAAQMNAAYIAALQLLDKEVLVSQFTPQKLDRDDVWRIVDKASCTHNSFFDRPYCEMGARVTITFDNGRSLSATVEKPRGMDPPATNEEILEKWQKLTTPLLDPARQKSIERLVMELESMQDVDSLAQLLKAPFNKSETANIEARL